VQQLEAEDPGNQGLDGCWQSASCYPWSPNARDQGHPAKAAPFQTRASLMRFMRRLDAATTARSGDRRYARICAGVEICKDSRCDDNDSSCKSICRPYWPDRGLCDHGCGRRGCQTARPGRQPGGFWSGEPTSLPAHIKTRRSRPSTQTLLAIPWCRAFPTCARRSWSGMRPTLLRTTQSTKRFYHWRQAGPVQHIQCWWIHGDEVILTGSYWVSFKDIIQYAAARWCS